MKTTKAFLWVFCLLAAGLSSFGQGSSEYKSGLKMNLNEEGSRYVRFIFWNQMWTRAIQNNPGTADAYGQPADWTWDIGLRRARILAYAQISKRYLILTHIGINNQTFVNGGVPGGGLTGNAGGIAVNGTVTVPVDSFGNAVGTISGTANGLSSKKTQLFFHDFWNEYLIFKQKKADLSVGFGLHYWNSVSRLTNASTLNFMTIDAPIFNWFNIDLTDQFARQFGVYAKGKLSKLDYRLAVNKPFSVSQALSSTQARHVATDRWSYGGYLNWQFMDQESNLLPFAVGTYVGTKKVFNLGFGFYHHPEATATSANGQLTRHNQTIFALDAFLDMPVGSKEKNMAFTAYGAYYNMDFGPNYYRSVGIMNVAPSTPYTEFNAAGRALDGYGNSRPLLGTGGIFYGQAGLLLPKSVGGSKMRVQPFAAYTLKNLEYLADNANFWDVGANFFLDGHHAKFTVQYSSRPTFSAIDRTHSGSRGEFIFQSMIFL